jgi:uncharacterized membrane protein
MTRSLRALLAAAIAALFSPPTATAGLKYTPIEPPEGSKSFKVQAVRPDGVEVVGLLLDATPVARAVRVVGGRVTPLEGLPKGTTSSSAQGINAAGQICGNYTDADQVGHGFLLSGGQCTTIDHPEARGSRGTSVHGIGPSGQVVGCFIRGAKPRGFLYEGGRFTTVEHPKGVAGTVLFGVNGSGRIVGSYADERSTPHGFLLDGGTFTTFDHPRAARGMFPLGIGRDGRAVGYYRDENGQQHGFVFEGGRFRDADHPRALGGTILCGVTDAGALLGGYYDAVGRPHCFLATAIDGPDDPGPTAVKPAADRPAMLPPRQPRVIVSEPARARP